MGDYVGIVGSHEQDALASPPGAREIEPGLIGGQLLRAVVDVLRRTARYDIPIILHGETGTGKEVVARAIHALSGREGRFYAVNCATLATSIADAELFGYRRGAFTGAEQAHLGHFRAADRGTLFLDEISELPLETQAKLLRVIEQREVLPIGETRPVAVDVRLVCACQTELAAAVERGSFRADLRARLSGYTCSLPPLRDRREDVPALLAAFLKRYSGGSPPRTSAKLIERLCLYSWPDNVRELELLTRSLLALHGEAQVLSDEFLPPHLATGAERLELASSCVPSADRRTHEIGELVAVLRKTGGNVSRAALELGLSRQRVYRLLGGLQPAEFVNRYDSAGADGEALHGGA